MSGQGTTWWLGEDRKWREGPPPAGWYQGTDGRWHPEEPDPAAVAAAQDPTEPIMIQPPPRRKPPSPPRPRGFYGLPQWTRVALGATAATVALVGAAVLTLRSDHPSDSPASLDRDGGGSGATDPSGDPSTADPDSPPGSASSDDPSTSPSSSDATTPSSTGSSSTTTEPPSTSAPPSGPLALCSPGQRAMIERATHPPEWYVERFDADHDGIFCE